MSAAQTEAQRNAFLIVPKISAFLSIIGSSIILYAVLIATRHSGNDGRTENKSTKLTPRHRILAGMSFCDLLASAAWFLTSWPIPADYPWARWNVGNQQTCVMQGFFVQWSIGTSTYNCCLAIYYLLVIRYGWSDERIARRVEPLMHLISVGFAFGTATAGIVLDLYNPLGWECWIAESPRGCTQSYKNDGPTDCVRGDNANLFHYLFLYIPTWIAFFILTCSMLLIYVRIRNHENVSSQHHGSQNQQRRFAVQALMYVGAFFLSWSIATSANLLYIIADKFFFWHVFVAVGMIPMQGFFNMIVYKLPSFQRAWRQRKRESGLGSSDNQGGSTESRERQAGASAESDLGLSPPVSTHDEIES